ncbi:MAG TPA: DUF3429 domain-containing protein [Caulobacteraceae bacterium]|nr:DUF3429 domain-containing protein [Caulobacteraceae bacterium]
MVGRGSEVTGWIVGVLGVAPFAAAAGVYGWGPPELAGPALLALLTYAAAILSFLGGVRWGAEIVAPAPRPPVVVLSVLPPLAAWALLALPFATPERQIGGFLVMFLACWLWDANAEDLPPWYRRLRTVLTLGAGAALGVALEQTLSL